MILLTHSQITEPFILRITDEYPLPFLQCYYEWEKMLGNDAAILWDDEMNAALPIRFHRRSFFLFGQFLFRPLRDLQTLSIEEEKNFLSKAMAFLNSSFGVQRILPSPSFINFEAIPDKSSFCPFGIFSINLQQSEEEIFLKIQSRTQRYIRQASKGGEFEIRYGESVLPDFYQLHSQTMKRENALYDSFEHLQRFMKTLSPKNILCMVVYKNGSAEAGLIIPYSLFEAVLYFGGESENLNAAIANKLLHWEAIKKLKQLGVKKLVLGGARMGNISDTKYGGIQFFKKLFGPDLEKGFLWKKNLTSLHPKLYDVLKNTKSLLTGKRKPHDIIDFYHQHKLDDHK